MFTKHFFKTLLIFTFMILFGLFGVFILGHLNSKSIDNNTVNSAKIE